MIILGIRGLGVSLRGVGVKVRLEIYSQHFVARSSTTWHGDGIALIQGPHLDSNVDRFSISIQRQAYWAWKISYMHLLLILE